MGRLRGGILSEVSGRDLPVIVVFNKSDLAPANEALRARLAEAKIPCVLAVACEGKGVLDFGRH